MCLFANIDFDQRVSSFTPILFQHVTAVAPNVEVVDTVVGAKTILI
jgi:hypothetical protein